MPRFIKLLLVFSFQCSQFLGAITTDPFIVKPSPERRYAFCVKPTEIIFYPFNKMTTYRSHDHYLSMILTPYIAEDKIRILKKISISPNGKLLIAEVSETARWQDGTRINAREAALGIAKGLRHRIIGKRVKVVGTEKIDEPGWMEPNRTYEGVKILSEQRFELHFDSEVSNLSGLLMELLGPGTPYYNRLWPARLSKLDDNGYKAGEWDLISNYPISIDDNGNFYLTFNKYQIALRAGTSLENSARLCDFFVAGSPNKPFDLSSFSFSRNHIQYTVIGIPNPKRLNIADRKILSQFLRASFVNRDRQLARDHEYWVVNSHFVGKELGRTNIDWSNEAPKELPNSLKEHITIAFWERLHNKESLTKQISQMAAKYGTRVQFLEFNNFTEFKALAPKIDVYIAADIVKDYRQFWMEDLSSKDFESHFLSFYPDTCTMVHNCALNSVITDFANAIPISNLDHVFFREVSVIPITRYFIDLYSRENLPIGLFYDQFGDIRFTNN